MHPKFHPVCSMGNRFELQAILRQVHRMTPKITFSLTRAKVPMIYVLLVLPSPRLQSALLYDQHVLRYKVAKHRKCTEWPQNDIERVLYTGYTPVYSKYYPSSLQSLVHFAPRPAVFKISHICNCPLAIMLNDQTIKSQTIKISKFILFTSLEKSLSGSIYEFWGVKLVFTFRG